MGHGFHVCVQCAGAFRREEFGAGAITSGIYTCPKCGYEGPLNVQIREVKDDAENKNIPLEMLKELKDYQQEIDNALSSDFSAAREEHTKLIERRAKVEQTIILQKRIKTLQHRINEQTKPAKPESVVVEEPASEIAQCISKSVLRDFSTTGGDILQQWHFPGAADVYFDEKTKDAVIGGRPRGSRAADLCAITSTDLKPRFFEHLEKFSGEQQILVIDNTDPPPEYASKGIHFTANEKFERCGLFAPVKKPTAT